MEDTSLWLPALVLTGVLLGALIVWRARRAAHEQRERVIAERLARLAIQKEIAADAAARNGTARQIRAELLRQRTELHDRGKARR
jgi:hypothetical protein